MSILDRVPALRVFTSAKSYDVLGVGNARANRLGLHPVRIGMADAATGMRRALLGGWGSDPATDALRRDGVAVVTDLLPSDAFERLRAEAHARMEAVAREVPRRAGRRAGFQKPVPFDGGFDRHDGGTLNRFVTIDERTPEASAFVHSSRLSRLLERAATIRYRPEKLALYEMTYGGPDAPADPQQVVHRDTFHSVIKLWFFLDDVRGEDGFVYARGSHRTSLARLRWEYRRSVLGSTTAPHGRGGAFRASAQDLRSMGVGPLESFRVRANTLIVADTRGFHRRGDAEPGARRLAIYGSLRPTPFAPVPY